MEFIKDQEKRILLAAISREKRVIKENPELKELIPVIEQIDYYFMYDRLFKSIYNQALDDFRDTLLELISSGYEYPNKQFLEGVYGVVNDAIVDTIKVLRGGKRK